VGQTVSHYRATAARLLAWTRARPGSLARPTRRARLPPNQSLVLAEQRDMRRYPVSTRVNHVENDDEDCAKAVEPDATPDQAQLF
jgi:hypothetical protein